MLILTVIMLLGLQPGVSSWLLTAFLLCACSSAANNAPRELGEQSGNETSFHTCEERMKWMLLYWDKVDWKEEYIDAGVTGTRCTIKKYLSQTEAHCPPPTEEDCECVGPYPAECESRIASMMESWGPANQTQENMDLGLDGSRCSFKEILTKEGTCPRPACLESYNGTEWSSCDSHKEWMLDNWNKVEWWEDYVKQGVTGSECSVLRYLAVEGFCPVCTCNISASNENYVNVTEDRQSLSRSLKLGSVVCSSLLIILCCGLICYTWVKRKTRIFVRSQPTMMLLFLIGSILTLIATLFLENANVTSIESQIFKDLSCMGFFWFAAIGISLTYSALIVKLWRIVRIFNNKYLHRRQITAFNCHVWVATIVSVDVFILIVWSIYSPMRYERVVTARDSDGNPLSSYGICTSDHAIGFQAALVAYQGFLFLLGGIFSYKARNADSDYQESRYIIISLVSQCQVYLVAVPLAVLFDQAAFTARFLCLWTIISSNVVILVLVMYIPKIMAIGSNRDRAASIQGTTTAHTAKSKSCAARRELGRHASFGSIVSIQAGGSFNLGTGALSSVRSQSSGFSIGSVGAAGAFVGESPDASPNSPRSIGGIQVAVGARDTLVNSGSLSLNSAGVSGDPKIPARGSSEGNGGHVSATPSRCSSSSVVLI